MQKRYFRKFATWLSQNCDMMLLFYKSAICKSDIFANLRHGLRKTATSCCSFTKARYAKAIFSQICDMVFAKLRHDAFLQKRDVAKKTLSRICAVCLRNLEKSSSLGNQRDNIFGQAFRYILAQTIP